MNEQCWGRDTDLTPQIQEPTPPAEERPTPKATESDWQGYSPEILSTVLDS
jgi:hypothetical protein